MRRDRRQDRRLPQSAAGRRLALSLAGCDLCEGPRHRVASSRSLSSLLSPSTMTAGARCWASRSAPPRPRFWTEFLRSPARRGLRGVKLVISDAHAGLKAAVAKVLHASWQRCRVHFMRNVLAHAGKHGRRVVAAFIATAFAREDAETARSQWRQVADQLRPKMAKLALLMDEAETDVLAFMSFPKSLPSRKRGTTGRRSTAPIHRNASMARSSAAPMSSPSSPTRTPSLAWSALSCSSRTRPCSAPAT